MTENRQTVWPSEAEERERAQIAPEALAFLRELATRVETWRADLRRAEECLAVAERVSLQSHGVPESDLPFWRLDLRRGLHVRALLQSGPRKDE